MKQIYIATILALYVTYVHSVCLDPTNPNPSAQALTFCSEYAASACCTPEFDQALQSNFTARIVPIYGGNNCGMNNLKALFCAANCHPNQAAFVQVTSFAPIALNVYVDRNSSQAIYESCENRCVDIPALGIPTMTIKQLFGIRAPDSFLAGFSSSSDPNWPSYLIKIDFKAGTHPTTGGSFVPTAVLPGSGSDLGGCTGARCFGVAGAPAPRSLTFCTEYASSACCSVEQENWLRGNFTKVQALFGTNGCSDNIRKMFCAWTCGGNQYDYIQYMRGYRPDATTVVPATLGVSINNEFATQAFNTCSSRCFDDRTGNPQIIGTKFAVGKPASLIGFFNSASDPAYQANTDTLPVVTYNVVATGGFNGAATSPSGADLTGCPTAPTGTTGSAGIVYPMMLLIVACLSAFLMF